MKNNLTNDMLNFISNSPASFQAVYNIEKILLENEFVKLNECGTWKLEEGGNYYITKNNSAIIAFKLGKDIIKNGFRIIASHTDSPSFLIKPNPVIETKNNYIKLNTEPYGSMILSSWLDRPLSIAGRVIIKNNNALKPIQKLIDLKRPILIIPNLAIHMNREINNGYKYNKQKDMLPLIGFINNKFNKNDYILELICKNLNINKDEIIDFELYLYEHSKGIVLGAENEFVSSSRLDDLMMVYTSCEAFINSKNNNSTNMLVCVDNEEVGSLSAQGAKSFYLNNILERIIYNTDNKKDSYYRCLNNSIMISADLAHGIHPNHSDINDITNIPFLGEGIVIKQSANQKYSTNSYSAAIFSQICTNSNIPFQRFVNRSDIEGGTTIGPIFSSQLGIPVIDLGAPILSMHSIRELCAVKDIYYSYEAFKAFLEYEYKN